ncbi:uncharacterized protein LOC132697296 [Cylas formicarius]|uniref:uncharacterized protein LOC132697296 n=1 Tax=Cylas formicarius TaxID=197179 RepID=UPI002958852B|nr:uncharacterized protein LOC132697296 [Cylas formicarius]
MGNLPHARVTPQKPFSSTGIDFSGNLLITLSKHRGAKTTKAYICLLLSWPLSVVRNLYSDNATNFVKANKELWTLARKCANQECIDWHFIPPSAPHFGGIWESGIKSVKGHLMRVIGSQILTYEELSTILCQIEAVLNSRPLTPLSSDPNDFEVSTPSHFLTGAPLVAVPNDDVNTEKLSNPNRWKLVQRIHNDFWRRWKAEYLNTLQTRQKWLQSCQEPTIGTLVFLLFCIFTGRYFCPKNIFRITKGYPEDEPRIQGSSVTPSEVDSGLHIYSHFIENAKIVFQVVE